MSIKITNYSRRDIEEIVREDVSKIIEPYKQVIDDMHIRLIDLERMIRKEKSK